LFNLRAETSAPRPVKGRAKNDQNINKTHKTFNIFNTKDSSTCNVTHNTLSAAV